MCTVTFWVAFSCRWSVRFYCDTVYVCVWVCLWTVDWLVANCRYVAGVTTTTIIIIIILEIIHYIQVTLEDNDVAHADDWQIQPGCSSAALRACVYKTCWSLRRFVMLAVNSAVLKSREHLLDGLALICISGQRLSLIIEWWWWWCVTITVTVVHGYASSRSHVVDVAVTV